MKKISAYQEFDKQYAACQFQRVSPFGYEVIILYSQGGRPAPWSPS